MSYTPSTNEIIVSDLPDFSSGGQNWAGEAVVIPLTVSSPSQFYVKSTADGSLIQVDPATAAQLYATSIAINDLNYLYGPGQAYSYPYAEWLPAVDQVQSDLAGENVLDLIEGFGSLLPSLLPDATGLLVPGIDAVAVAALVEGVVSPILSAGATNYANDLELALADKYLQSASTLLDSTETEYNNYIFDYMTVPGSGITNTPDQAISYGTVYQAYYNTVLSIDTGQAASGELASLTTPQWQDLQNLGETAFNLVFSWISDGSVSLGLIGQLIGGGELFQAFAQSSSPSQFASSLQALIAAEGSAVNFSSPFAATAIAKDETILADSVAETQGQVLGSPAEPSPQLIVGAKASDSTPVNTDVPLDSLFTPSVAPSGSSDTIDDYTLINALQGPGELIVNDLVYTQGEITDITPAQFQTAYFTASQPGSDKITVVAYDSAGNTAFASTAITAVAAQSPEPSQSDLKISTAALVSSSLVAGGGGTVTFSVTNLGSSPSPGTAISQIYLSTDATLDSSDILISPGAISDAGLAADAGQPEQLSFTLPSNIAGSYCLIVFAGDSNQVTNGAAAGNAYAIPITVAGTSPPPPPSTESSSPSGPNPISIATDSAITTRVGSEPVITSSALRAVDTQYSDDSDLRYTIVTPPAYGQLVDNFYTTSTFTQADIDNGLVDYVQNGTSISSDSFSFYVSDPAGYRSPVKTFTFNILPALNPPPPPTVSPQVTVALADDTGLPTIGGPAFSTSNATLNGTANPGATVVLLDGSTLLGSPIANSAGNWSFAPSGLAQGSHSITASVTISGQTATNYFSFAYDTVAPPAPSTPQLELGGNIADTATPIFSGTAEVNDQVLLLEGNSVIGSGMATPQGTWTIETGTLGLGYHTISAESIDPAGNIGPLSSADTIEVVPPPPGEMTLNDAAMLGAGDLSQVGTVDVSNESLTEYSAITADGFSLRNSTRSGFAFISWNAAWAFIHNVGGTAEYYDGAAVLIVPTDALIVAGNPSFYQVGSAIADTIDLSRTDGTAFSLVSIDIGPTGDYPTSAVFTGTLAGGGTITETVALNLPQNSPLQPVALTGFNDVTDVQFTESLGSNGDPTSIAFDNILVGDATAPPAPPAGTPLSAPVTLDDAAIVNAGELPLVSTDNNVFSQSTTYDYGPITADGFTIINIDRSDYAFFAFDSHFAAVNGYFYDGPDVFAVPIGQQTFVSSRVQIQRQDGEAFAIESIELDTLFVDEAANDEATFTGTTVSGNAVTQTFQLDNVQGMQTFTFDSDFEDLASLQFSSNTSLEFDDVALSEANTADYSSLATLGLVAIVQGAGGTVNKGGTNGTDTLTGISNLVDMGSGRANGDVFYVDANETVTASNSNFNFLIELSAGVNLAYGNNFAGITEFVSNTGTNTVSFATDLNFAYLFGSTGNDTLTLGSGGGYLFGEGGTNILTGGANATNLFVGGDGGSDTMNGGTGSASNFYFVDGNDQVNGAGAFNAMVELVTDATVQLGSAQYQDVQEFVADGGTNAVTIANADSNFVYLYGGTGNDTLTTGSGGGYLFGEGGTNVLTGGGDLNVFVADGASGVDTMNGGSGSNVYFIDANSTVQGAGTFNTVVELQQNVSLAYGSTQLGSDIQEVVLNGGTNTADFSSDPNQIFLYGGAGTNTLSGGSGNDFLYGGTGTNTFGFKPGWGMDTIMDWTAGTNDQIDLTALAGLGVHAITDLTQTITGGNDVITSSHTGTNSITVSGLNSTLNASSFHFA